MSTRPSIDAFVTMFRREIDGIHRGYPLMVRKHENSCSRFASRSILLGDYLYLWSDCDNQVNVWDVATAR